MTTEEKVIEIIKENSGMAPSQKIELEDTFTDDLGCDSLDLVVMIMAIEEEFDIEISDEDIQRLLTVQSLIDYVKGKVKE